MHAKTPDITIQQQTSTPQLHSRLRKKKKEKICRGAQSIALLSRSSGQTSLRVRIWVGGTIGIVHEEGHDYTALARLHTEPF